MDNGNGLDHETMHKMLRYRLCCTVCFLIFWYLSRWMFMNNDDIHIFTKNVHFFPLKLWIQWQDCCKWCTSHWHLWQWFQVWIHASGQRRHCFFQIQERVMCWDALSELLGKDWRSANNCSHCPLWTDRSKKVYPCSTANTCCREILSMLKHFVTYWSLELTKPWFYVFVFLYLIVKMVWVLFLIIWKLEKNSLHPTVMFLS